MKIAMLSPPARRISPRNFDPLENAVSLLTEGLLSRGIEVTLFNAGSSEMEGQLENPLQDRNENDTHERSRISECLRLSALFERGEQFDLIHSHFDFLPLTYVGLTKTPLLNTIQGSLSPEILPVYQKFNKKAFYVSTLEADKNPDLEYIGTIPYCIDTEGFSFRHDPGEYLLFIGDILPENGLSESIEVSKNMGMRLIISGMVRDRDFFENQIRQKLDGDLVQFLSEGELKNHCELLGGAYALLYHQRAGNFGFLALEAMACGTPVISLDSDSIRELISDGITGFLVSDWKAVLETIPKIKHLDRSRSRKWVIDRFGPERMTQEYVRIYERIILNTMREDRRPWGFYEILSDTPNHKVKRLIVFPSHRLSYQRHFRRSEHWFVVRGRGVVTKNGEDIELNPGQTIDLPFKTWHRIRNSGHENLVLIEVQTGEYFGEDDIERVEDDFGRV